MNRPLLASILPFIIGLFCLNSNAEIDESGWRKSSDEIAIRNALRNANDQQLAELANACSPGDALEPVCSVLNELNLLNRLEPSVSAASSVICD